MKRLLMAFVIAALVGAFSGPSAMATTTRIPTFTTTGSIEVLDTGTWWYTGSGDQVVEHVRGTVMREEGNWNSPYAIGPAYNTVNWNLNMSTGRGAIWGSGVHYPTAFPGSQWDCTFQMPFNGMGGFAGKGVCQGTGELAGWQWRVDLTAAPWGGTTADGYIFEPGD